MQTDLEKRITIDPEVMLGKPVITGTRIPVYIIVRMVAQDISFEDILRRYHRLTRDDILAALQYAASTVDNEETHPVLVAAQ